MQDDNTDVSIENLIVPPIHKYDHNETTDENEELNFIAKPIRSKKREDDETMTPETREINVSDLKPHPKNEVIYGQQEDVSDLVKLIGDAGRIIERLIITKDNVIISGHRRWLTAKILGHDTVPCEVMEFETPEDELEELVLRNAKRTKTTVQKIREGMTLESVYSNEAKIRKLANLKQNKLDQSDEANSPGSGATRDKVAKKAGISSDKTYHRGKNVLMKVDELRSEGKDEFTDLLLSVLNKSTSAAGDLLSADYDNLTNEQIQGLKSGKIAPRSLVPKETKEKETKPPTPLKSVANEVDAISKAVMNLNKLDLEKVNVKNKDKIRNQIQVQIKQLQELMSKLEME